MSSSAGLCISLEHAQWRTNVASKRAHQHLTRDGRDALQDPAAVEALLSAWRVHPQVQCHGVFAAAGTRGVSSGDESSVAGALEGLRPMPGEQTNASLLNATAVIKLYRTLSESPHPDVAIPRAATAHVAEYLGHVEATFGGHTYTLAVATKRIPEATDAWSMLTSGARAGDVVLDDAAALGAALRQLHHDLAAAFGTHQTSASQFRQHLHARAQRHLAEAPELGQFQARIAKAYERIDKAVDTQRIHGDLHLGQVLWSKPSASWYFVDFEGEPDTPLRQRIAPQPAAMDVAGLIRSYHYAGHEAPQSLLDAYGRIDEAVVNACVIDRFCYEVAYEKRHRPDWVAVPLRNADALFD